MNAFVLEPPVLNDSPVFVDSTTPCENLAKQVILISLADGASEVWLENDHGVYRFYSRIDDSIIELTPPPQHLVQEIVLAFRKITSTPSPLRRNRLKFKIAKSCWTMQTRFPDHPSVILFSLRFRSKQIYRDECLKMVYAYWRAKDRLRDQPKLPILLRMREWFVARINMLTR
jgi:hypothetical protein